MAVTPASTPASTTPTPPPAAHGRWPVLRWQAGYATMGVPPAAAPIAFTLLTLPVTGSAQSGAGLVTAMTAAQIIAAVPVARLGRRFDGVHYLRVLVAVRALALAGFTALAGTGAPYPLLVAAVVAAGAVNGAAYGVQRTLLNHLVDPRGLPRALGVAATLNEATFALTPVLASVLGAASPVGAMVLVTALGAAPLLLVPTVPGARRGPGTSTDTDAPRPTRRTYPRAAYVWLLGALAGAGVVASVEIGAVSFALRFDLGAQWAFLFALVLCLGSVTGGVVVSVRNRVPRPWAVVAYLAATAAGSSLVLLGGHLAVALAGAAVIGFFLPALGTFYSLALDRLAPPERRAELFALLRTATSLGVVVASGLLALLGLRAALVGTLALLLTALAVTALRAARPAGRTVTP
ncbi:putative arabinose efflux permease, MFS family [Promicromonospora thailandica]|uniref:Arabinose efflux permease, MFS family n=1 Tax=Promicromonospora thailandica TaxID=765201 RepID=A0A9X2G2S6_9MICO|nr:putative arabinose efflux permease, MFS family [Promicromonospora thailandica]